VLNTKTIRIGLGTLIIGSTFGICYGQEVYKSVDENGKVTYSTVPPTNVDQSEVLDLLAEPSESDISMAQQRNEKLGEELERTQQARAKEAERLAQSTASSRRETIIIAPPNPAPLLYPYSPYRGYWRRRPGYRHRVPGHHRARRGYRTHRPPGHLYRPRL